MNQHPHQATPAAATTERLANEWHEPTSSSEFHQSKLIQSRPDGDSYREQGSWTWIRYIILFPVYLLAGIVNSILEEFGSKRQIKRTPERRVGTIEFAEQSSQCSDRTTLKTFLGKGPSLLVVFSRSHLAVLDASRQDAPPELIWQNPQGTYVLVGPPDERRLDVHWPEAATLSLYLDEHQYQQVTNLLGPCITDVRASNE